MLKTRELLHNELASDLAFIVEVNEPAVARFLHNVWRCHLRYIQSNVCASYCHNLSRKIDIARDCKPFLTGGSFCIQNGVEWVSRNIHWGTAAVLFKGLGYGGALVHPTKPQYIATYCTYFVSYYRRASVPCDRPLYVRQTVLRIIRHSSLLPLGRPHLVHPSNRQCCGLSPPKKQGD